MTRFPAGREGGTQYQRGPRPQVSEGSEGKVLKMDGPSTQGFLSLTGPLAPRVADCPSGNTYKVSVTGFTFSVIWHEKHSAELSAFGRYTPYPAAPDFSTGKRVTRFSGCFAPLRIVFPCHPCSGGRIKHLKASLRKRLCSKHGFLFPVEVLHL